MKTKIQYDTSTSKHTDIQLVPLLTLQAVLLIHKTATGPLMIGDDSWYKAVSKNELWPLLL